MANPRFYTPETTLTLERALQSGESVLLTPEAAHHAGRALRLRNGEAVTLFNDSDSEWEGTITLSREGAAVQLTSRATPLRESPLSITLLQALVSPEKMDWILEKAVELGVRELVLFPAERSVTKLTADKIEKRLAKYRTQIISASEQCGRNRLMTCRFLSFKDALMLSADCRLVLAPSAVPSPLALSTTPTPPSFAIMVGPEGGLSDAELSSALEAGWQAKLLGPRVMRTETAGLAATVWLNTRFGDFI